jgi:cell division protein FtsB
MKTFLRILRNRYFLFSLAMMVILTFLDRFSIIRRIEDEQELHKLNVERDYYKKKAEEVKRQHDELFSNDARLEKFARERYYMKKDNEDIYIVVK